MITSLMLSVFYITSLLGVFIHWTFLLRPFRKVINWFLHVGVSQIEFEVQRVLSWRDHILRRPAVTPPSLQGWDEEASVSTQTTPWKIFIIYGVGTRRKRNKFPLSNDLSHSFGDPESPFGVFETRRKILENVMLLDIFGGPLTE